MSLRICHTGDWHLGHTLYRRERAHEHARFLAWLLDTLEARRVDALIIAGDVFDSGSPPGSALAMFYGFLADVRRRLPELAVVIVAGNHDSPARLAAPDPVLRAQGVSIVGSVPYEGARIAAERMVVAVTRGGRVIGRVVAVPFLRGADLPPVAEGGGAAVEVGARQVYDAAISHALQARADGEPIVVTGHFAAAGARMSRESERLLALGVDGTLPIDVIDTREVAYVALGHLHLAQPIGRVARYAGSPIPLSFAERDLEHEVRFVTIDGRQVASEAVRVPRSVALVRVPATGLAERADALAALGSFPTREERDDERAWPWVEVRVRAGAGERDVLDVIEAAAQSRAIHLVHVVIERPEVEAHLSLEAGSAAPLDVRDVLVARWIAEHGEAPSADVLCALAEATAEARVILERRRQRAVEIEGEGERASASPRSPAALALSGSTAARRSELG